MEDSNINPQFPGSIVAIARKRFDYNKQQPDLPNIDAGVKIVECVESNLIKGEIIGLLDQEELKRRINTDLVKCLEADKLLVGDLNMAVSVALFIWHGCICMAKLTREKDSGVNLYTQSTRMEGYTDLKNQWEEESAKNNPWIKAGVSMAKTLETSRRNASIDDWVPRDSPYWN